MNYQEQLIEIGLTAYVDAQRHLVCKPYSIDNLHKMAKIVGIKRCWFHKDHYDVPKREFAIWTQYRKHGVGFFANWVSTREIFKIIQDGI